MGSSAVGSDGSADYGSGLILGNGQDQHPLTSHPAVENHGTGTSTPELTDFIRVLTEAAISRVQGIGDEQYGTRTLQRYESMSTDEYVDELLAEVYDIMAYLAMIALKIIAVQERSR